MEHRVQNIEIFLCYAHEDRADVNRLKKSLATLQREGLVQVWHDADISPGTTRKAEIERRLNTAQVILLLISPNFIASDYCYDDQMRRAIERHERGEAHVIPIILRPVDWEHTPFGQLQALPQDARPITLRRNPDEAWLDVARGVRTVVEEIVMPTQDIRAVSSQDGTRSSRTGSRRIPGIWILFLAFVIVGAIGLALWFLLSPRPSPPSSVGHLLYTYYSPSAKGVYDVEWSPRGDYIACLNANDTVQLIALLNGGYSPTTMTSAVNSVTWSPGETLLASANADHTVQVWEAVNGASVLRYSGHAATVVNVDWSPDGTRIASGDTNGIVQVWDAKTGKQLVTYRGHSHRVWWLAWSPDSKRLASGGDDITVQVWDANTGKTLLTYKGHTGPVYDVMWSPDGQRIASASADGTAQVWDATTGKTLLIYKGHSGHSVQAAQWSPDGKRIASAGADTTVQVWDAATGKLLFVYHGHTNTVYVVAWSPDGKRIASASADGTVQVWQAT